MDNIILTGYMGSGKTTAGKCVAEQNGYTFADTDELIEKQQQRSISEIFASDGEQAFRNMETELLKKLIADGNGNLVISTGGGMPVREENRPLLSRLGKVVYLKADPQTIYNRIKGDLTRPLLQCGNPGEKIKEMLAVRGPIYEQTASVIIEVDGLKPSDVAEEIMKKCGGKGEKR